MEKLCAFGLFGVAATTMAGLSGCVEYGGRWPTFAQDVEREVTEHVRHLKNHPEIMDASALKFEPGTTEFMIDVEERKLTRMVTGMSWSAEQFNVRADGTMVWNPNGKRMDSLHVDVRATEMSGWDSPIHTSTSLNNHTHEPRRITGFSFERREIETVQELAEKRYPQMYK